MQLQCHSYLNGMSKEASDNTLKGVQGKFSPELHHAAFL